MDEIPHKMDLLRNLADRKGLDAVLLQRVSSVAWATAGAAAYVNIASSLAECALLVSRDEGFLITNNIEAPRLEKEEQLKEQGWNFQVAPWYEKQALLQSMVRSRKLGSDACFPGALDLSGELAQLRAQLLPQEGQRFRILGQLTAQAMYSAARSIRPGQTEYEIAGLLAHEAEIRGVQATVNLVATDDRIYNFRHPLPSSKKLERYAMLILCGRRFGLICSLTRLVHFGELPEDIQRKSQAVAQVDAAMITATRPGRTLGEVFSTAQSAYAQVGYADEWKLHHQGGPAGYEPREVIATPGSKDVIVDGQVFAWNPSITGTKSEDSILVNNKSFEVLTSIPDWPMQELEIRGQAVERPAILVVD
jgi:Xaa-Pro aminopeptidase